MSSDYERRRLDEIEAALRQSDPGLDRALRTFRPRRTRSLVCLAAAWFMVGGAAAAGWWIVALVLLGPLLALTCIALGVQWRAPESSAMADYGMYPPMWTRFWG